MASLGKLSSSESASRTSSQIIVISSLWVCNLINILFLLLDPRNPTFDLSIVIVLLAAGFLYVIALVLCYKRNILGFILNIPLGILASIVVVGDNLELFESAPDLTIYVLNFLFFIVQIPLIIFSILYLLKRRKKR